MIHLEPILAKFQPITLKEMDSVKLQDRVDTKFMFIDTVFPDILEKMKEHYSVLEVNEKRYNNYETLYFDTHDFKMYLHHHNGKANRYKFRARKYVESNLHFFEVKFKSNRGRTIKNRIKRNEIVREIVGESKEFLQNTSGLNSSDYFPKLWVNYTRMTFVNRTSEERLTIDLNLTFKNDHLEKKYDRLVIAEVKRGSAKNASPFINLMKQHMIREKSISKYCLGIISLNPEIKKNNFKPTLLYLNKILNSNERYIS